MNIRRNLIVSSVVAVAAAAAFLGGNGTAKTRWDSWWNGLDGKDQQATHSLDITNLDFEQQGLYALESAGQASGATPTTPRLDGGQVNDLGEVFRFNIDPRWVVSRWSRVSIVPAGSELKGMRVTMVSGTAADDIVGSLTYYFDGNQQLRRIRFYGWTGDERKLAALVKEKFRFHAEPTLGAGLYLARWNGKPVSGLWVGHAAVVAAERPRSQLQVVLEINRPTPPYRLSEEFNALLETDRHVRTW
jgi:hypothetical protein